MGQITECCKSKKADDIKKNKMFEEKVKKSFSDDTAEPKTPATPGVISMDEQTDRLSELFEALEEQFQWYLDKEFQFPTSKAELIESPDKPILKFEIFYEFYRSAMIWNKILIQKKKYENTENRRKMYKENKLADYMTECQKYAS